MRVAGTCRKGRACSKTRKRILRYFTMITTQIEERFLGIKVVFVSLCASHRSLCLSGTHASVIPSAICPLDIPLNIATFPRCPSYPHGAVDEMQAQDTKTVAW